MKLMSALVCAVLLPAIPCSATQATSTTITPNALRTSNPLTPTEFVLAKPANYLAVTRNPPAMITVASNQDASKSAGSRANAAAPVTSPATSLGGENVYCGKGDVWIGPATDGPAQLPKRCIYTGLDGTPSLGAVKTVPAGGNVAEALARAKCGDTIKLTAGATYAPFMLPAKNCDARHWITIRTSAPDDALPPEHSRINPSYAGVPSLPDRPAFSGGSKNVMAAIVSPKSAPAISVPKTGVANYYRLGPGLEVTRAKGTGINYQLITLGINADHVILDRDWIHGSPLVEETTNGVGVGGSNYIAVINSYMNDFKCVAAKGACTDAKTIGGGDDVLPHAEGVWKAYNNFLEASGENILHGGALYGNQTPMDLEYRENHFYKPPTWRTCDRATGCYVVKNLFELKNGSQVLLEGNRMEGSWGGYSQAGFAILFTPRGSWSHVDNITVRYNYISHVAGLISMWATTNCDHAYAPGNKCPTQWVDSASAGNWSIHDLLFDDVDPSTYKGSGTMQIASQFKVNPPLHDITMDHLTVISADTKIITFFAEPTNRQPKLGPFAFTNSIVIAGRYNIWSTGGNNPCVVNGNPRKTFSQCFTTSTVTHNLVIGWKPNQPAWPDGNVLSSSPTAVFVNFKPFDGDYHVQTRYQRAGTDGKDIGADLDMIRKLLANVE